MTEKRFTNIEHDYENAWIKCKDNGDFMIYAIYKELDESLPSLEDLLNGLSEENEQLKEENKELQFQYNLLREQANEFHRGTRENANRVGKLEKENKELKQFKEKVFDWINGEIDSTKESHNVLFTDDEAEAIMEVLIRFKKELFE